MSDQTRVKLLFIRDFFPPNSHHWLAIDAAIKSGDARAIGGELQALRELGMSWLVDGVGLVWQQEAREAA